MCRALEMPRLPSMWFTDSIYWVFLAAGFTVGFGHCIGMCGPIVVSLSLSLKEGNSLAPHLFYNLGRTFTYTVLGAAMGVTGSFTGIAGSLAGFQKTVMILAGLLIVVMGAAMTGIMPTGRLFSAAFFPTRLADIGFKKLSRSGKALHYLPLGVLLGFLPCGPVYTALISSARCGMEADSSWTGALSGAGVMFSFGIGTVPALLAVGRLTSFKWLKARDVVYRIGGFLMIGTGIYFVVKAIGY